jgi:hypothetical protein
LSAEKYSGIKGTGKVPLSKYLKKQTGRSVEQTVPRKEFFYWSDNGDLMAIRYNHWKLTCKTIEGNLK